MINSNSDRINLIHIHNLNGLMLKILAVVCTLSLLQDLVLYFGFKHINLLQLTLNVVFMLTLTWPSYYLYKRNYSPRLLGYYNVFVCISYIAFTLINYDFSPFYIMFIAFNIIVASIYLELKGYVLVSLFSLVEVVIFSHLPAYVPPGEFWLEVINRMQVIFFVSLFCYGVLKPSQLLVRQLIEQEIEAMQMAHELRNPLTTVKGFLQLISNRNGMKNAPLELVLEELDRANSIIADYLTLYKPLPKNFVDANINDIIKGVTDLFAPQANRLGIVIEKRLDLDLPCLYADINQIKQVLVNLLENSIQAIGCGGEIIIRSYLDKGKNHIVITISDNGPGFPGEMLKKDLTPFFTTKQDGNGLGLPVCKKIVNIHGGSIEIGNNPNKGSYVSISLPVLKDAKSA